MSKPRVNLIEHCQGCLAGHDWNKCSADERDYVHYNGRRKRHHKTAERRHIRSIEKRLWKEDFQKGEGND